MEIWEKGWIRKEVLRKTELKEKGDSYRGGGKRERGMEGGWT